MSLTFDSIASVQAAFESGDACAEDAIALADARIAEHEALGAIVRRVPDDRRWAQFEASTDAERPLRGIPFAVKDNLAMTGVELTCGSQILKGYKSPYEATVISRLRASGAVPVAVANMDEFAMGSSNEHSSFFPCRNPHDTSRVAGGSSGGSAAAVAAGLVPFALGSDTGGSVRQPAAFCGVVGLKPTYGTVSRRGLVAFASSLDQVGPITRNVRDCRLLFDIMAGHDPLDATSVPMADRRRIRGTSPDLLGGLKVGVLPEALLKDVHPEVVRVYKEAEERLRTHDIEVVEVDMPHLAYAVSAYYVIAPAEAASNLARFDGVRYGARVAGKDIDALLQATRSAGFGTEVKRRILLGNFVLSEGFQDEYYGRAQRVRTLLLQDILHAFEDVHALFWPTTPTTAFELGEKLDDPVSMYLADVFTIPANLAGVPALSLPCGRDERGLPIGLQLMGPHFAEHRLFDLATKIETDVARAANGL